MLQKWSTYVVLQQFFDVPRKGFLIRELSRNTHLAQTSIRTHLKVLIAEGLIVKNINGLYPSFSAVRENSLFKLLKTQNIILQLQQTGLVRKIEKTAYPSCIILFGSASRGEDNEESDIDLFVQAKHISLDLKNFEKLLKRKISVLFEPDLRMISKELRNNLANGIVLYGYLTVV